MALLQIDFEPGKFKDKSDALIQLFRKHKDKSEGFEYFREETCQPGGSGYNLMTFSDLNQGYLYQVRVLKSANVADTLKKASQARKVIGFYKGEKTKLDPSVAKTIEFENDKIPVTITIPKLQ